LWRIASEAAVEGVSIEQTMLRIVAANPSAFQDGNVNGLMAGYVLQLPDETDIRIGLASALDEVAEQKDERGLAVDPASSGLTPATYGDLAVVAQEDPPDAGPEPTDGPEVAQSAENVAPSPNATVAELSELESPLTTVGQLQSSIEVLQGRLAEQDAELTRLRARLATRDISEAPGEGEGATGNAAFPGASGSTQWLWPLSIGAAVLLLASVTRIWGSRGRHSIPAGEADDMANAGASSITAARPEPELEQSHSQRSDTELSEEDTRVKMATSTATSGLSLAPVDAETEDQPAAVEEHAAIYGSETDPMDSQLDLARAYIDMGDEEGARPVLMSVIKEGDLSQQAQARELLLRIEVT
jgi:pilus assembly protein FimV